MAERLSESNASLSAADPSAGVPEGRGYRPPLSVTLPDMLVDGSDETFRRLIYGLFVVRDRLDTCRDAFGREVGLSRSQYWLLIAVARMQGEKGTGLRAIADQLMVAPSFVTMEVNKLVAGGLIAKVPNPDDRRGVLVSLTPEGEATLDRLAPFLQEINDTLFDGVDRREFETVLRFIDRFVVNTALAVGKVERRDRERAQSRTGGRAQAAE